MYREMGQYIIRGWKMEDAPSIAKYANNRKIWLNLRDAFPHPFNLHDANSFIARAIEEHPKTYFAIATPIEAIGSIGITLGKDVHRYSAELGYWLAEPFWGKGIMTQATKIIAEYAIHELNLHRVFAEPYSNNPASARVLEKAGFTFEGIMRSSVFKDGKIMDQFLFGYTGKKDIKPLT